MADSSQVNFGRFLNHAAVDRAARRSGGYSRDGWRNGLSVVLDLEATEFVDYAAAARLVSLTEGLARAGIMAEVRLPNPGRREREEQFLEERVHDLSGVLQDHVRRDLEQRINSRRGASSFLRHIGVVDALTLPHLSSEQRSLITIVDPRGIDRVGPVSLDAGDQPNIVGGSGVRSFPAILPLRWIRTRSELFEDDWQQEAIDFLFDQGLMVTRGDAESLVTTVFRELLENVLDHGEDELDSPPGAIFGAMTLNRSGSRYRPNVRDSYESYHSYLAWLADQESPIVRVVVTDSGHGLVETLRPVIEPHAGGTFVKGSRLSPSQRNAVIVGRAFEPTVSCKADRYRRGVGLTIVRRFVRSYRGLVSVRTANVAAGFECHDVRPVDIADLDLHYVPGTSIELFFGLTLRNRERLRGEQLEAVNLKDLLVLDVPTDQYASTLATRALAVLESSAEARLPIVILLINGWPRHREARASLASALSETAVALDGHAAVCAVLDAASDVDCDTVFRTMDELRESTSDGDVPGDWHPPFLVLSATGRPLWSGGTHQLRGLLYRLLDGETIDLDGPDMGGLDDRSASYLRLEQDWFRGASRSVKLRVAPVDIDRAIAADLASKLEHSLEGAI